MRLYRDIAPASLSADETPESLFGLQYSNLRWASNMIQPELEEKWHHYYSLQFWGFRMSAMLRRIVDDIRHHS
jgi:hypothetical protein